MPYEIATIAGSILDFLDGVQYARVQMIRLEGPAIDGQDAHLAGIDVQYSPTKTTPAPVVATGTYRVIVTATTKSFPKRDFTAPINGDTSWGEVLSYDGTGYEYTPDERARLVAVEQAVAGGLPSPGAAYIDHGNQAGALTIAADDGTHAMVLTGDLTITLTGSNGDGVIIDASGSYALTVASIEVTDLTVPAVFLKSKGTWKWLNALAESTGPVDPDLTPATPAFPLTYTDDGTTRTYVVPTTTGVNYYLGGSLLTSGTKTATPLQAVIVTPVAQATYTLTSSTPWTHTFAADPSDTTAPTAPALSVDNSSQTQLVATFGGGTDAVGVTRYRTRIDAGSWTIATSAGSRTFAGLTASTSHTIDAQAGDAAGNWSASTSLTRSTASASPSTWKAATAADGPVFALDLDDVTGTTVPANTGSNTTGAASIDSGPMSFGVRAGLVPGYAHCVELTTGGESVLVPPEAYQGLTALTVCFVIQVDAIVTYGGLMIGYDNREFGLNLQGDVGYRASVHGAVVNNTDTPVPLNTTIALHMTWDGSTIKLYENGSMVATGPAAGGALAASDMHIPYPTFMDGAMNGFNIYDHALTAGQVLAHAQAAGLA